MKNAIVAAVVVVVGAAAFWGGGFYKEQAIRANPRALFSQGGFGGPGGPGGPGARSGGGQRASGGPGGFRAQRDGQGGPGGPRGGAPVLSGTLDEVTDDELTITTTFGSVTVKISGETEVKRAQKSDIKVLKLKKDVIIESERDDEGNMTAKAVIQ